MVWAKYSGLLFELKETINECKCLFFLYMQCTDEHLRIKTYETIATSAANPRENAQVLVCAI